MRSQILLNLHEEAIFHVTLKVGKQAATPQDIKKYLESHGFDKFDFTIEGTKLHGCRFWIVCVVERLVKLDIVDESSLTDLDDAINKEYEDTFSEVVPGQFHGIKEYKDTCTLGTSSESLVPATHASGIHPSISNECSIPAHDASPPEKRPCIDLNVPVASSSNQVSQHNSEGHGLSLIPAHNALTVQNSQHQHHLSRRTLP